MRGKGTTGRGQPSAGGGFRVRGGSLFSMGGARVPEGVARVAGGVPGAGRVGRSRVCPGPAGAVPGLPRVRPSRLSAPAPLSPATRAPPSAPHPQPRARPPWVVPCSGRFPFFFPLPSVPARWFPFFRPGAGVFRPGAGVFRPGAVFSSLGAFSFVPGRVSFVPVCRAGVLCCLCVCSVWSRRDTPVKYYGG